jgi:hypothetical protein
VDFGDDEQVAFVYRAEVYDNQHQLVFMEETCGKFALADFAEGAVFWGLVWLHWFFV